MSRTKRRVPRNAKQLTINDIEPCPCGCHKVIPLVDCRLMVVVVECQGCGQRSSERQCLPAAVNNWNRWVHWRRRET